MEGYELGRERGTKGENVQRIRSMNGRYKIDRGEAKNSIGNVEATELICTMHGRELKGGNVSGSGYVR